ncbi:hypothetical protein CANARDRAFT_27590 [[Candida] arabinofermentans NRRL YB-2248]|uniref:Uncharacterized protein n=1 Tax=[Candida] arabinofermentans NRRL YB-2248 TaxID=983967 RepID=A0A1E4T3M8_9ASCO|nr:hypothetical protein CANARDRAFT_27590 [[Candida] arabinofermentans NRRL YB-2248]
MSEQPYYIERLGQGSQFQLIDDQDKSTTTPTNSNLQFKIVIVGDSGCGKTSLLSSYIRGSFPNEYEPTIFENHRAFLKDFKSNQILTIDLWDTAGQEDYERLRRLSYQDSNLIILTYNLNSSESLLNIPEAWAPEILTYCENTPIILIGLKADLPQHKVNPLDALKIAKNIGAIAHIQCSAKEMFNVDVIFNTCANIVFNSYKKINKLNNHTNSSRFSVGNHIRNSSRNTNNGYQDTTTSTKVVDHNNNNSYSPVISNDTPYVIHKEQSGCCVIV